MLRKLVLLPVIFWISVSYLIGQPIISGKVFDRDTGELLPGVHVIYGTDSGVLTDSNGMFQISIVPGNYTVTFRYIGYQTTESYVVLEDNDSLELLIGMIQDITRINEIVVSAGKSEQRVSDLSVSMNILKPYQLTRNHIINAEEVLHKTTGIEVMDGQVSIRGGSGYSYGAGSRVMTLIDGLPALSTDAGNVKWGTLPIENISRIEVIKGASSVLYGSSALNGVINFITRDAVSEPLTKVSISTGIFDRPSNLEWKWWDKPRTVHNVSLSHSKMYGNTEFGVGVRAMSDVGYRKLNDDNNIRLSLNLKQHSVKYKSLLYGFSVYGSYNAKNDFLLWENADDGALKQSESTAMEYRGLSVALDPFISITGKMEGKHEIKSRMLSNLNRLPENTNNNSDSHSVYLEYQYSKVFSERISGVAGVAEQYSIINSNFYGDHKGLNVAGYAQVDYNISERLKTVSGFRLEQNILDGDADKFKPIFRAGVNYKAGSFTFFRASFGQGYRYPSIAEKHAYTTVGAINIFPNIEIRPEAGWSSELGIKRLITTDIITGRFDFAIYFSQNHDMIEYVFGNYPDPITSDFSLGFRPVNIENSRVLGFETELFLNWSNGSLNNTLSSGYTYMHPVEFNAYTNKGTGDYLKYRRKHSANISYNTMYGKFEGGFVLYLKSKILDIDDVFVNELTRETILPGFYDYWIINNTGYFLIDLRTAYRINNVYLVSFVIKNLTNTEYMGRPGDIQPQRYYSLMLTASF